MPMKNYEVPRPLKPASQMMQIRPKLGGWPGTMLRKLAQGCKFLTRRSSSRWPSDLKMTEGLEQLLETPNESAYATK